MKRTLFSLVFIFSILATGFSTNVSLSNLSDKKEKLSIDQRVKIMANELKLTASEQVQMSKVLNDTQKAKEIIKASTISEKAKVTKVDKIKETQKENIKKLLGKQRYEKYKELKKKNVF